MEGNAKRYAIIIIFLGASLLLMMYIAMMGVNILRNNRIETEILTNTSINCIMYSYVIEENTISYSNNTLRFTLQNKQGETFTTLIIIPTTPTGKNETYSTNLPSFSTNSKIPITVRNITIKDSFTIYPHGCQEQNKKTYTIPAK